MKRERTPYVGKWELLESDEWDKEWIDLSDTGFIKFTGKGDGEFLLGALDARLEYVVEDHGAHQRAEFCWAGTCEGDDYLGRGWVEVNEDEMTGHLYIYGGDNSRFTARRFC